MDLNVLFAKRELEALGEEFPLMGSAGGLASIKLTITMRVIFPLFL